MIVTRMLVAAAVVALPVQGALARRGESEPGYNRASTSVGVNRRNAQASTRRTNYLGYYFRWGSEGGTCVGGVNSGQNPDLMDVWLKGDGVDDVYLGETAHYTSAGCDYHQGTWLSNPLLSNGCDGSTCNDWLGNGGYVEPHVHHSNCAH